MVTAQDELRGQVRYALISADISQARAARKLDISEKHLSQMLTGRATLTLDWAEKLLGMCGMRLVICTEHDIKGKKA